MILTNEKKFVQHKFDYERIQKLSGTQWFPLTSESRIDYIFEI